MSLLAPPSGFNPLDLEATSVFLSASRSIVGVARRRRNENPANCATGFLWDKEGTVVTNFLPFASQHEFLVFLGDGRNHDGRGVEYIRIAEDERKDLAVLRPLDPKAVFADESYKGVRPLAQARSHELQVGQSVYSIGNLFGMQKTFHGGILSGIGRNVHPPLSTRPLINVLQTDVLDERGGLGSILLNSKAELVGIVSSLSSGVQGATFAVAVDDIQRFVVAALLDWRRRGFKGLHGRDLQLTDHIQAPPMTATIAHALTHSKLSVQVLSRGGTLWRPKL